MFEDKDVDVVYVATVHVAHKAICLPLLERGKNVLCEKPLSVNAKETIEIYEAADKSEKFFLVGLWSRFFPAQQKCGHAQAAALHAQPSGHVPGSMQGSLLAHACRHVCTCDPPPPWRPMCGAAARVWEQPGPARGRGPVTGLVRRIRQLIDAGALGEVLHFHGSICLPMGEEVGRLYDPEAGGGALLDIGLYMLTLASWVYGCQAPEEVKATSVMHENGIDVSGLVNLRWGPGAGMHRPCLPHACGHSSRQRPQGPALVSRPALVQRAASTCAQFAACRGAQPAGA